MFSSEGDANPYLPVAAGLFVGRNVEGLMRELMKMVF